MNPITLTGLTIWNGYEIVDADAIRIEGEQITAVGDGKSLQKNSTRISCDGATAIPGLIDAHVHLELNPEHKVAPERTDTNQDPQMAERAAAMARSGITTARDLGGGAWLELKLRDRINAGELSGPRLICSGQPITSTRGHCHFWGGEAANLEEAEKVLQRQVDHGVDLIKVMASGGRMTAGSDPRKAQFDVETLSAIVAAAHSHGLPVAAHCHGTEGIEVAALAGVNTIEHCSWVGKEGWASDYQAPIAQLILDRGIWVSPTVNKGWQRMLDSKDGSVLSRIRKAYVKMLELGIPFVASTDAGIPGIFHHELPLALNVFSQIAELSPVETLRSATSNAARALGLDKQTGALLPGLSADVVLLDGNPLTDLAALTSPVGVWTRGRNALPLP
ncbi:MAG: amidohydrolase family protein [Gammaproteobacteria bacterium]|nr:amidohydrolase family protein [Gammaproteobacteria bacterium]